MNFKKEIERLEKDGFRIKESEIAGDKVFLVTPDITKTTWDKKSDLIYRSSVWTEEGKPVSLSWKKFFNYTEGNSVVPDPTSLKNTVCVDKIDGSTLLVSKYKGVLVMRTRGTFDISSLDNGSEKEFLLEKYKTFFDFVMNDEKESSRYTYVFEWTTPNNRIILSYGDEPELYFTGIIDMEDYTYLSNSEVDEMASRFNILRPKTYYPKSLDLLIKETKAMKGIEGFCLYYNNEQDIKKIKTEDYLMMHSFKMSKSTKAIIRDIIENYVSYEEYKEQIISGFDFECWAFIEDKVKEVYSLFDEYIKQCDLLFKEVMDNIGEATKKEFAIYVMSHDECKEWSPVLFKIFSNKGKKAIDFIKDDGFKRKMFSMIKENISES